MDKQIFITEINRFANGDKKARTEIIKLITSQLSKQSILLNKYIEEKNTDEIKKTAHFLTSTFLFLKLDSPLELVTDLRNNCNTVSQIKSKVKELIKICEEIIEGLKFDSKK